MSSMTPNVFDYLNYSAFLKDLYDYRKSRNTFFSYRYFGKALNLDPGFLVKVTQGKLALPEKCIAPLVKICSFEGREVDYFRELVYYGRAKNPKDIKRHFERLIAIRDLEPRKVEMAQYAFYQKWYHSAIHSLLLFHEFKGDFKALAAKMSPNISVKEAKESIQLLEDLGFIRRQADGRYEVQDARITTGGKWQSVAIRNFQEACIKLAGESLTRHPKEIRDISTVTITLSSSNIEEVRAQVKKLLSEYEVKDPKEVRRTRRNTAIKRLVTILSSTKRELESEGLLPSYLIKQISELAAKLEDQIETE